MKFIESGWIVCKTSAATSETLLSASNIIGHFNIFVSNLLRQRMTILLFSDSAASPSKCASEREALESLIVVLRNVLHCVET